MHMILVCRSLTTAQKAARILQNEGIFASIVKAPQSANPSGCGYGVKIAERNLEPARTILAASDIRIERTVEAPSGKRNGGAQ